MAKVATVEASAIRHGEVSEGELHERAKRMGQHVAALPPDRFPALLAMGHRLGGGGDRFDQALDLIIDGLVARRAGGLHGSGPDDVHPVGELRGVVAHRLDVPGERHRIVFLVHAKRPNRTTGEP